jgi:hypothetical protein
MHRTTRLVAVAAALLLAAGCGGSAPRRSAGAASSAPVSSVPSRSATAVEPLPAGAADAARVLKEYLAAFAANDAVKACALESPAFARSQVTRAVQSKFLAKGGTCVELVTKALVEAKKRGGDLAGLAHNEITALQVAPTAVTLRVAYPASASATPESYGLVRSGNRWLVNSNANLPNS